MRRMTARRAILAVATLVVAASVALATTLGARAMPGHSSSAARASDLGQSLAGGAYWAHGQVHDPPAIASRISRLNNALDACYTSNGATRVSIAGGGWTYQDPNGVAAAVCQSQQDASNAFADGPEMVGYSKAIHPLIAAFWSCMTSHDIVPPDGRGMQVDTKLRAFNAGAIACSAAANSQFGAVVPAIIK